MAPKDFSDQGREAELTVLNILQKWEKSKKFFRNDRKIVHVLHAEKYGCMDRNGIDLLVFLDCGAAIPLQVKSHLTEFILRRHRKSHPHVRFVIGVSRSRRKANTERISTELEEIINQAITDVIYYNPPA